MAETSPRSVNLELSVVVPVKDEAGNTAPLVGEIDAAILEPLTYEIVIVDDGSDDGTGHEADTLSGVHAHVRVLHHARCCGQSQATISGALAAHGEWIITIDGDNQTCLRTLPNFWTREPARVSMPRGLCLSVIARFGGTAPPGTSPQRSPTESVAFCWATGRLIPAAA